MAPGHMQPETFSQAIAPETGIGLDRSPTWKHMPCLIYCLSASSSTETGPDNKERERDM